MNLPPFIFEVISLIASFAVYFQKPVLPYLKYFPVFLFITVVCELIAWQLSSHGTNTIFFYTWFTAFEFEFYLFTISMIIQGRIARKIIWGILILYLAAVILDVTLLQSNTFHTITYSFGCLLVVAGSIYYFLELFRLPNFVNLLREPAFWICSGLSFFYCCTFPLIGLFNFTVNTSRVLYDNLGSILTMLNILLYSLYTIAFLCNFKIRKGTFTKAKLL